MESYYQSFKHSHLMFICISIALFNLRFWLRTIKPQAQLPKPVKILPHINDTLLLFSGMIMVVVGAWTDAWLLIKLCLVLVYIGLGFVCMKNAPRSPKSVGAYAVAMLVLCGIVYLAQTKPVL